MIDSTTKRHLAAIFVADVVGYSKLMAADETGTLAALKERRSGVLEPVVKAHGGRVIKFMGDGVLVEFTSAVNAVRAALELQEKFAAANKTIEDSRRIVLRIGINLGDVIGEGSDIYGDGVNVAARLEALAEPGGICLSGQVFDAVRGKINAAFVDLGEQSLKNIETAIRAYSIGAASTEETLSAGNSKLKREEKASIAVLPFENMSADPEQTYFSDGITEDIITNLSKYRELLVIARNSSFQFRGKSADVRDIGRKLGVQYIVEGSVRRAGGQIRVTAQLVETGTSTHVWAERYDRELQDIFAIQDEITQMVTARVSRQLKESIVHRARNRLTSNLSAYEAFLQAQQLSGRYDMHLRSREFALRAVELDPNFAAARAILSISAVNQSFFTDDKSYLVRAVELAKDAIALDSSEPLAHAAAGLSYMHSRRYREARTHLDESLSLNPNDTLTLGLLAFLNGYTRRYSEALSEIDEALRRDPYAADWFWDGKGTILMASGKPREALASFERMKYVPPWVLVNHVVCHVELGNLAEASAIYRQLRNDHTSWLNGDWLSNPADIYSSFEHRNDVDRFVSALRRAADLANEADQP